MAISAGLSTPLPDTPVGPDPHTSEHPDPVTATASSEGSKQSLLPPFPQISAFCGQVVVDVFVIMLKNEGRIIRGLCVFS